MGNSHKNFYTPSSIPPASPSNFKWLQYHYRSQYRHLNCIKFTSSCKNSSYKQKHINNKKKWIKLSDNKFHFHIHALIIHSRMYFSFYFIFISLRTSESCRRQRRMNFCSLYLCPGMYHPFSLEWKWKHREENKKEWKQSEILHT